MNSPLEENKTMGENNITLRTLMGFVVKHYVSKVLVV